MRQYDQSTLKLIGNKTYISMKQLIAIIFLLISVAAKCQNKELIHLWPGKVPGESSEKLIPIINTANKDKVIRITEITNPEIEIWLPDPAKSNGSGVIICPGGGYIRLSYNKEGTEIDEWLNKIGSTIFILTYRVPNKTAGALQDAQRALRIVRSYAAKWKLRPGNPAVDMWPPHAEEWLLHILSKNN
jgi:acetyl esterase/lipase